jgi:DNA helicase HerA-like ATPase
MFFGQALEPDELPPATAHLGRLLNRVDEEVKIELPVNEYAATHLAILASTGSGKSYTASVLIEEMMQPDTRASMLVFDPHGEYDTLDQMRDDVRFEGDNGYLPDVDIRRSDQLSVRLADLTYGDLLSVLDGPTSRMESVLYDAYQDLRGEEAFSINQLQTRCDANHPDGEAEGLRWRINKAFRQSDFFQQHDRTRLTDIISPGKVTVLQMDGLSKRDQQMMAAVLLRKLYNARQAAEGSEDVDVAEPIEHPVFTLFEEAHRFAPDGSSRALDIIRQVNSEGRKFGLGTGLISQRPSKLDPDALSQCGTQIIMQIQNPADQQAIKQSVESAGEAILEELPGLTKGQAVVSGDAVNTPVLVKVRERHTEHGAESLEADKRWRNAYDQQADAPERSEPANDHRNEDVGPERL